MIQAESPKFILAATLFVLILGLLSSELLKGYAPAEPVEGSWSCTADFKVCPDGSEVGRVPPYCQFAKCPTGGW